MSGRDPETELAVREWLVEAAPNHAPASLRETLEDITSQPAGRARPWPGTAGRRLRFAGRLVAAAAVLAVAVSGAYLLGGGLTSPGAGTVSPSTEPQPSPTRSAAPMTVAAIVRPQPTVAQLPGSNWKLVDGALPQMTYGWSGNYSDPIFSLPDGGFLAFVLTKEGDPNAVFSQSTTFKTRVFKSGDGLSWTEVAPLPTDPTDPTASAYVAGVAEAGGRIVAVGRVASSPNPSPVPMVWTTNDLETWQAIELPATASASAWDVATGPAGFLVRGDSPNGQAFWASSDGSTWHSVATSGLPADIIPDSLYSIPDGYAIRDTVDRARVWTSPDGAAWTEAWQGPPSYGQESYSIGPIVQVPDGSYVSFGAADIWGEQAVPPDLIVWNSSDRIHWTEAARVQRPGKTWNFGPVPGGFVAAGFQGPDYSQLELGVWTSADGRTWQLVDGLPSIETPTPQVISDGAHTIVFAIDPQGNIRLIVSDGLK